MGKRQLALDIYMSRMFKSIMFLLPLLALGAGINFTTLKFLGFYENVSFTSLFIFDGTNILYCILGAFFALNGIDQKEGNLKPRFLTSGKIIVSFVVVVQWNYISYMIPSRDFWAFFALFIFVSVFFLDSKYVLHTIGTVILSIIISWIIKGDELLPVKDELFIPDLILRCILITFVSTMMFLITLIIEKLLVKELENIAEYDSLTLLRNRRSLNYLLDDAIENEKKTGKSFCFVMADIDDFKVVNDTYGHPFGDIVLKNIAKTFIFKIGEIGTVFRYGGEEICALLYLDLEEAKQNVEELRKAILNQTHRQDRIKVNVTMSFGITEYKHDQKKDDLIKVADSNLYYAKNHGKNQVIS